MTPLAVARTTSLAFHKAGDKRRATRKLEVSELIAGFSTRDVDSPRSAPSPQSSSGSAQPR